MNYHAIIREFERQAQANEALRSALPEGAQVPPLDAGFARVVPEMGFISVMRECRMRVGMPCRVIGMCLHSSAVEGGIKLVPLGNPAASVAAPAGLPRARFNADCYYGPVLGLADPDRPPAPFDPSRGPLDFARPSPVTGLADRCLFPFDCPEGIDLVNRGRNEFTVFFLPYAEPRR